MDEKYKKVLKEAKRELDAVIDSETKKGIPIKTLIREGELTKEVLRVVQEKAIDLLVLLTHEEGRLEHFLFGPSQEELLRLMPCSILML